MTPLDYYREQCQRGQFIEDDHQRQALIQLDRLHTLLLKESQSRRFFPNILRKPLSIKGIYLCGNVGVGKTTVMDSFYHSLPIANKLRVHFHQFMHDVHAQLKEHQGKKNPLQLVANHIAKKAIVICLDELHVHDIADAVILAGLFKALITSGVCLVITSNTIPDELYKHGLQRISFLPAIALIKQHCHVINFETMLDYRLNKMNYDEAFFWPNDDVAHKKMIELFDSLNAKHDSRSIIIYDRPISVIKKSENMIWFDFKSICSPPRSPADYLVIVKEFRTIFISNIPQITSSQKDRLNLFMRMIDIFYDAGIRFICSAEVSVEQIYMDEYMSFEYKRTRSRLIEMLSKQ